MDRCLALIALSFSLAGCGSAYTQLGYEVTRTAAGSLAPAVADPDAPSGSVAVGFGTRAASMEVVVHGQEIEMAGADPLIAASAGLELKLRPLRYGPFAAFIHGGPQRAALFDRSSLSVAWGVGYSYGAGFTVGKGGLALVLDARADEIMYAGPVGSPTFGTASLRTLSVGLQLGH